jgi:hypothetical protein
MVNTDRLALMATAASNRDLAREDFNGAVRDGTCDDGVAIAYYQGEAILALLTIIADRIDR